MEALSCLPFAGAGLWDFCCSCVLGCVSSIGVFSLYSSIKPPLFIFTRNPLHWLPLFSGADPQPSVICTENYKSAAVSRQSGQPSCRPGSALCHRLSCPWLRRSGGGRGREGVAAAGPRAVPARLRSPSTVSRGRSRRELLPCAAEPYASARWFNFHGQLAYKDRSVC